MALGAPHLAVRDGRRCDRRGARGPHHGRGSHRRMRARRRNVRELTVQILFQIEVGHLPLEEVLETARAEMPAEPGDWGYVAPSDWEYIEACVRGTEAH